MNSILVLKLVSILWQPFVARNLNLHVNLTIMVVEERADFFFLFQIWFHSKPFVLIQFIENKIIFFTSLWGFLKGHWYIKHNQQSGVLMSVTASFALCNTVFFRSIWFEAQDRLLLVVVSISYKLQEDFVTKNWLPFEANRNV